MGNEYFIDIEKAVEEKRREDLVDLLRVISEKINNKNVEYIIDVHQVARFELIKERIQSYFADMPEFSVKNSIDEDCTSGLITITAEGVLNLELTEEIKMLLKNCTRMDISPRNNGIVDLDFNFLNFRKKRYRGDK